MQSFVELIAKFPSGVGEIAGSCTGYMGYPFQKNVPAASSSFYLASSSCAKDGEKAFYAAISFGFENGYPLSPGEPLWNGYIEQESSLDHLIRAERLSSFAHSHFYAIRFLFPRNTSLQKSATPVSPSRPAFRYTHMCQAGAIPCMQEGVCPSYVSRSLHF
jgi:hypothetical protein